MKRATTLLKFVVPIVIVAVIAGVARAWPTAVAGRAATGGVVTEEILGIGTLEGQNEVRVSFEAGGRVTSLAADEGDTVVAGAPLGAVDAGDAMREQAVSVSTRAAASDEVERATAELDRARATATLALRQRVRIDTLFATGDATGADQDAAVERDEGARAAVRSLEAALRKARSSHDAALGSERIRAAQVSDGALVSPVTGLVIARDVEVGQWITGGAPAFTIVADDALEVHAWVDETGLARLAVGQPVRLVFRSEPDRNYIGRLERIGREVDRETHELLVDVAVVTPPSRFAVGQRVDAWIEVGRRDAVARVPRGWCGTSCLVAVGGRAERRPVEIGLVGRDTVEIVRGLSPGDVVLPDGAVGEGRRVRVTP